MNTKPTLAVVPPKVPTSPTPAPIDGHAETVLENLEDRRDSLKKHNRPALIGAANELAAMHKAAVGHVPAIRADKASRYRLKQLMGIKGFGVEDFWAVKDEGPIGLAVAMASLRLRASALGMTLTPLVDEAPSVRSALVLVLKQMGRLNSEGVEALEDGTVAAYERQRIRALVPDLKAVIAQLEAADAAEGGL